jgi:hypothetical protein
LWNIIQRQLLIGYGTNGGEIENDMKLSRKTDLPILSHSLVINLPIQSKKSLAHSSASLLRDPPLGRLAALTLSIDIGTDKRRQFTVADGLPPLPDGPLQRHAVNMGHFSVFLRQAFAQL